MDFLAELLMELLEKFAAILRKENYNYKNYTSAGSIYDYPKKLSEEHMDYQKK